MDSYSKWPEVLRCRRPTTGTTIGFLHELFARFGVVDCVVRYNGSQFTSAEFKEFYEIFQIKHITTPQYHPRSNGQAERFVDTLKQALKNHQVPRRIRHYSNFCRYTESHPIPIHHWQSHQPRRCLPER